MYKKQKGYDDKFVIFLSFIFLATLKIIYVGGCTFLFKYGIGESRPPFGKAGGPILLEMILRETPGKQNESISTTIGKTRPLF